MINLRNLHTSFLYVTNETSQWIYKMIDENIFRNTTNKTTQMHYTVRLYMTTIIWKYVYYNHYVKYLIALKLKIKCNFVTPYNIKIGNITYTNLNVIGLQSIVLVMQLVFQTIKDMTAVMRLGKRTTSVDENPLFFF